MIEQGSVLACVDGVIKQISSSKPIIENEHFNEVKCMISEYKDGKFIKEQPLSFFVLK